MNIADQKLRDSPLWRKVVKAHSKLAAAQAAGDGASATKAWRELSDLIEGNAPEEEVLPLEPPISEIRQELEALFPYLRDEIRDTDNTHTLPGPVPSSHCS